MSSAAPDTKRAPRPLHCNHRSLARMYNTLSAPPLVARSDRQHSTILRHRIVQLYFLSGPHTLTSISMTPHSRHPHLQNRHMRRTTDSPSAARGSVLSFHCTISSSSSLRSRVLFWCRNVELVFFLLQEFLVRNIPHGSIIRAFLSRTRSACT